MQRSNLGVTGFIFSLALAAFTLSAEAQTAVPIIAAVPITQVYSVYPNPGPAHKSFTLTLDGGNWGACAFFLRESVTVTGKRIDLTYTAETGGIVTQPTASQATGVGAGAAAAGSTATGSTTTSPVVCAMATTAKTSASPVILPANPLPTFTMPALDAGSYEVYATSMPSCLYSTPRCAIAVSPQYAGTLVIAPQSAFPYTFTPVSVDAGKTFDLHLLSYSFNCNTTFSMMNTAVIGNVISLTYLDQESPTSGVCPAIYMPYGPTFSISALKAGSYTIQAYQLPACAAQGCKSAAIAVEVGTLTVRDPGRKGWFLETKSVVSGVDFKLHLLNNALGSCGTSFNSPTVTVSGNQILASFNVQIDSAIRCIQSVIPYGPTFEMKGLTPGSYPVLVSELMKCQITPPYCPVAYIIPAPSDTLVVTKGTAILKHGRTTLDAVSSVATADFIEGNLRVTLPSGARGLWRVDLLDARGRRLGAYADQADGGQTLNLGPVAGNARGIYLVRLQGPAGETRMLPLLRKD